MRAQDQEPADAARVQPRRTATQPAGPEPVHPQAPLTRQAILHLQRTAGNAAVAALIEARRQPPSRGDSSEHGQPAQRSTVPDVLRSPGRPIDDATRTDMEARLGADFSDVRLHTDTAAQESAAEVGARAYTSGSHVVTGDSGIDRHTLAHELTHVIQQRRGPVAGTDNGCGLKISDPADSFEREAEVTARRALSGQAPAQHEHGPAGGADNADHSHAPVQRMDVETESQSSRMDIDEPPQPGRSSSMEIDQSPQPGQSDSMEIDEAVQPADTSGDAAVGQSVPADPKHKAEVSAQLKASRGGKKKWNQLDIIGAYVIASEPSTSTKIGDSIKATLSSDRKGKRRAQKGQLATRTSSRKKQLSQIDVDEVMEMYRVRHGSTERCRYLPAPGQESTVWAEVEAVGEYMIRLQMAQAAAGGALFQTGEDSKTKLPKKQAALRTTTIAGQRGVDLTPLTIPGKNHIRPVVTPTGPDTPDQVTTPDGGTVLDRVGVYTFDSDDGTQFRDNFYAHNPENREDVLDEIDQSTLRPATGLSGLTKKLGGFTKKLGGKSTQPGAGLTQSGNGITTLGSGLTRYSNPTKVAGQISLDEPRLARWHGRRSGSQNSAMYNTSAKQAAEASGYDVKSGWQWLHLIAFSMGGRDDSNPNEEGNLVAGLAAANGFHLALEGFVKKMVQDKAVSDVTVKATAHIVVDSFHVAKSIEYRISWKKNGENKAGTFIVHTLDPNKMMGSHTELLCKRYGIDYPEVI